MSPTTLALTVLGATATSTGIGIAVVNLATTNNESIENKIEKLWEEIKKNIKNLTSQINTIMQNKDSDTSEQYRNILTKIFEIANTEVGSYNYQLKLPTNTESTYKQLQKFQKEMNEVLELLEKSKENSV